MFELGSDSLTLVSIVLLPDPSLSARLLCYEHEREKGIDLTSKTLDQRDLFHPLFPSHELRCDRAAIRQ
jgi:hypothetical protein